jgi:hypothetical protein
MNPSDPEYADKPYDFDPKTMQDERLGQGAVSPLADDPNTDTPRDYLIQEGAENAGRDRRQGHGEGTEAGGK